MGVIKQKTPLKLGKQFTTPNTLRSMVKYIRQIARNMIKLKNAYAWNFDWS